MGCGTVTVLASSDLNVVEVNRPNRQTRRRKGKSDTVDAEMAARAVLAGDATVTPKAGDGPVEALRQLRLARRGAVKARTAAANQMHSLTDTAPDELRAKLRGLTTLQRARLCARFRAGDLLTPAGAAKRALRSVAARYLTLHDEPASSTGRSARCSTRSPSLWSTATGSVTRLPGHCCAPPVTTPNASVMAVGIGPAGTTPERRTPGLVSRSSVQLPPTFARSAHSEGDPDRGRVHHHYALVPFTLDSGSLLSRRAPTRMSTPRIALPPARNISAMRPAQP